MLLPQPFAPHDRHSLAAPNHQRQILNERISGPPGEADVFQPQFPHLIQNRRSVVRFTIGDGQQIRNPPESPHAHPHGWNGFHNVAGLGGKQRSDHIESHDLAAAGAPCRGGPASRQQNGQRTGKQQRALDQLLQGIEAGEIQRNAAQIFGVGGLARQFMVFRCVGARQVDRGNGETHAAAEFFESHPKSLLPEPGAAHHQPVGGKQQRGRNAKQQSVAGLSAKKQREEDRCRQNRRQQPRHQRLIHVVDPVGLVNHGDVQFLAVGRRVKAARQQVDLTLAPDAKSEQDLLTDSQRSGLNPPGEQKTGQLKREKFPPPPPTTPRCRARAE